MNLNLVVLGLPRTGKTMFCINFAEYLGARSLCYTESSAYGRARGVILPQDARAQMIYPGPRCNGVVRTFAVNLLQKNRRRIALVDTASLKEKTPLPRSERQKLLLTLQALQLADAVLYLIDISCSDPSDLDFAMAVNRRLADYCLHRSLPFLVLGSKRDRVNGAPLDTNGPFIPGGMFIPVSSVTREGFAALRNTLLGSDPLTFNI